MISWPEHPVTAGPVRGGFNMLMPSPYDPEWTGLQEVFNDYPPAPPGIPPAIAAALTQGSNNRHSVTVPIAFGQSSTSSILPANAKRKALLLQNNSTAVSPDVAPTFYFNFNTQAVAGFSIALPPGGQGLNLDCNVSADSLYVTIGPFVNTGDSVVIQGCVLETAEGPQPNQPFIGPAGAIGGMFTPAAAPGPQYNQ